MNKINLKNFEVINGYAVFHERTDGKIHVYICKLNMDSAEIIIERDTTDACDCMGNSLYRWISSTTAELRLNVEEMKDSYIKRADFDNMSEFEGFKRALEVIG